MNRAWVENGRLEVDQDVFVRVFRLGQLAVLVGHEGGRWHLSISHRTRYPTWDEIADARYDLLPDEANVAMFLPPRRDYMNVHPYTFHLWEIRDPDCPRHVFDGTRYRRTHESGIAV